MILESIDFPAPVIQLAIEPKTKADQEKLGMAIAKLVQEDPTLKVSTDPDTGQTILAGMGELHLEIIVDRMQREFSVGANVGKPQVAYRETIRQTAEYDYTHKKQTGGSGQYARVKLRVEPLPGGEFEFDNEIKGGNIPKEFIPAIEKGVVEALEHGILAGYPMSDVRVTVFDGAYHDVDSSEMAFKICSSICFKEAARKAKPVLLEPVMRVEVVVPDEYMGTGERRPDFAARTPGRHRDSGLHAHHQGDGAAVGNVRIRDRVASPHAGPRRVHHAFRAVRGSAEERSRKRSPAGRRAGLRALNEFRREHTHGERKI